MTNTERHVKRLVFGRLLPVRGVDHVWERRYGWHWVVEKEAWVFDCQLQCKVANGWEAAAWAMPKEAWAEVSPVDVNIRHGYQPKRDGREGDPPGAE